MNDSFRHLDPYVINPPAPPSPGLRRRFVGNQKNSKTQSTVFLPRLVDRNYPFQQSQNRIAVKNENHYSHIWPLLIKDWFHVCLRVPIWITSTALLVLWTLVILAFSAIYVHIDETWLDRDCGLGEPNVPIKFGTAFAFSLETCTTVGYGLPGGNNGFFQNNCPAVQVAIYAQMIWSMMFNAFLFAFFFTFLAKCENRSIQVVFADKMCINVKNFTTGRVIHDQEELDVSHEDDVDEVFKNSGVCVNVRCYDIDSSYPVVETHARMYMMDKNMKLHTMRLQDPDDEMGGTLYTSIPTEITHHVDHHSPLSPPHREMPFVNHSHGLVMRAADSATGSRDEIVCPVCGEAYGTYARLRSHVRYARLVETRDGFPKEDSHLSLEVPDRIPAVTMDEVRTYMSQNMAEIIVVVEGIDPQVSGTFQALQSYKYDDICWEGEFEPCLKVKFNKFHVCMEAFHKVRDPDEMLGSDDDDDSSAIFFMDRKEDEEQALNVPSETASA